MAGTENITSLAREQLGYESDTGKNYIVSQRAVYTDLSNLIDTPSTMTPPAVTKIPRTIKPRHFWIYTYEDSRGAELPPRLVRRKVVTNLVDSTDMTALNGTLATVNIDGLTGWVFGHFQGETEHK
jgi:hypothetical protein